MRYIRKDNDKVNVDSRDRMRLGWHTTGQRGSNSHLAALITTGQQRQLQNFQAKATGGAVMGSDVAQ